MQTEWAGDLTRSPGKRGGPLVMSDDYEGRLLPPMHILQQAEKGRFMIFPGTDSRLFYLLTTKLPKSLVFTILDTMTTPGKKAKKA